MSHEEFNNTIRQKMDVLADTETNRKRKEIDTEINNISKKIQKQKDSLDADIAAGKYDDAVTAKTEISRLESKQDILKGVAMKLDEIPEYDDADLRKLSDEVVNYYNSVLKELYESRIKILEQLDENYKMMEDSKESYKSIKQLIDSKATSNNYDFSRKYTIPYSDDEQLFKIYGIEKRIKSIEESLKCKRQTMRHEIKQRRFSAAWFPACFG